MTIFGWDASDFDHDRGPMDMAAARMAGIDFYTHKATEGTGVKHHPGPSLTAARAAGIPFLGCYMVPRTPGPSVEKQVDYFLTWVGIEVPWWKTFPGWFWQMDTEHWGYDNVPASVGHQAAQVLAQRTGKTVLHYAPKWAYGDSVPAGEPLWASAYVTGSGHFRQLYPGDTSSRWVSYSGRAPAILQYTSSAVIGRQPVCDANAFRGTVADFARLIGAVHHPAKGDIDMEMTDPVPGIQGLTVGQLLADMWKWSATARGLAPADTDGIPQPRTDDRFSDPTFQGQVVSAIHHLPLVNIAPATVAELILEQLGPLLGAALLSVLASPEGQAAIVEAVNTAEDS